MPTLGENLRALRRSRGYSQQKMAEVCGTNQTNISYWELDGRNPNLATVKKIADIFKVPLSSLIPMEESGLEDDFIQKVADMIDGNPKVRTIYENMLYLSDDDLDVVVGMVTALAKGKK